MTTTARRRSPEAAATREKILAHAVQIASVRGLAATSIGDLASAVGMSKSGLFAHFSSKEQLEVALIEEAGRMFRLHVVEPAMSVEPGILRLRALLDNDVRYCTSGVFQGGCFFSAVAHEVDGRSGPARDRLVELFDSWEIVQREQLEIGVQRGEVRPGVDATMFVFASIGVSLATNWQAQLRRDADAARKGHSRFDALLESVATPAGLELLRRS